MVETSTFQTVIVYVVYVFIQLAVLYVLLYYVSRGIFYYLDLGRVKLYWMSKRWLKNSRKTS